MNLIYEHGGDIYGRKTELDFSVSTNPLGISEAVKNAYINGVSLIEKYPDNDCRVLRKLVAGRMNGDSKTKSGFAVLPENIFFGCGAADIIYKLVYAVKPKTALVASPTFSEYENALLSAGCIVRRFYLKEENGFAPGEEILNERRADIVFICNPNNPTGRAADEKLLYELSEKCRAEKSVFAVDECFAELSDIASVSRFCRNAVIINAFTKTYAMAGLRLGYMIGDTEIIEKVKLISPPWCAGTAAQKCAEAALSDDGYLKASRAFIKSERQFLYENLNAVKGVKAFVSDAPFIMFKADKGLFEALSKRGILIRKCANFDGLGDEFFRIGIKRREDNIRLLEEIEKWQCR